MDQVFTVRQVCEKYLANGKDVFRAFMELEKAFRYCRSTWYVADAKSVWSWRKIVESSFYVVDRKACVRVGNDE